MLHKDEFKFHATPEVKQWHLFWFSEKTGPSSLSSKNTASSSLSSRVSNSGVGGHRFETKGVKNGTNGYLLEAQHYKASTGFCSLTHY